MLAIGFFVALVFAWVFELTPAGLKRDHDVLPGESIAPQTAQRMNRMIIAVLEKRAELMAQEGVLFNSLDPYAFSRNAYFEYIEFQVYDGQPPLQRSDANVDDYLSEIDDE